MPEYYVYIMTNKSRTLYVGVTNDLERRVYEHKHKLIKGFTSKYNITMLVWYEAFPAIDQAIEGEKRLKGWLRSKKVALIEGSNPEWEDLSQRWYGDENVSPPRRDSSLRSE
jgi:putative endonuclease